MSVAAVTTTSFSSRTSKKKWSPSHKSVEEITQLLKAEQGPRLEELKLCWREPRTKNESVGLLTKKNVAGLEKAIKKTPSLITHLSLGWKHGGDRKSLIQLLQVFINHSNAPALELVDSVELVLATWVPDSTLLQLLLLYASRLKSLKIQSTRMKVRTTKAKPDLFQNTYQSVHAIDYVLEEESVAKIFTNPKLTDALTSLKSLSLIDCDVLDEEVDIVIAFLVLRSEGKVNGASTIENLSLRSNRHMSPDALQKLVQAPVSHSLDFSLCDIKNLGVTALARAFAPDNRESWRQQNSVILKKLIISGNYQIDERGFSQLCRSVPYQVQNWNMSYCDITDHQSRVILQELVTPLLLPSTPLQELTLQGLKINNPVACEAIQRILLNNRSLTTLVMNDPKYPNPTSVPNMRTIADGLRHHYGLQELQLDMRPLRAKETKCGVLLQVVDTFEFYLALNRAGRRMLQNSHQIDKAVWVEALLDASLSGRLDVLYWMLSNAVVHLF